MNALISETIDDFDRVSWQLFDYFDIQKSIRGQGGIINTEMALEDAEYFKAHPEEFPNELKKKTIFLWNTLEVEEGIRKITMMFWFIDEVATYQLVV